MTKKFPGGFITKSPTAPSSSAATGIWTLEQAAQYKQASAWPTAPAPGPSPGGLWTWGQNNSGQLGQNNTVARSSPVQVGAGTSWLKAITAVWSAAIKTDGTLWTWGENNVGQLCQNDKVKRSSPTQVGALTNWSKIWSSGNNFIGIKTDGTLWGCGFNIFGYVGDNTIVYRSSPVQIGANTWSIPNYQSAIRSDGTLWIWGGQYAGRWGNNTSGSGLRSSPVQLGSDTNWVNIKGTGNMLAVKSNGTLWSWGQNNSGELGQNDKVRRSSPVQIGALTNWATGTYKISATNFCMAIKTDGTLWGWGRNYAGQLGDGTVAYRSSPVQIGSLTNWSYVTIGAAVKTDGTLWTWGKNDFGQLGQNNLIYRSSPVQVGSDTTWQLSFSTVNDAIKSAIKT